MYANIAAHASENVIAGGMKLRSAISRRNVRSVTPSPPPCRRSGGSVSGSHSTVATSSGIPITASTMKIPRHEVIVSACPPTSGANTGATPITAISSANTRAAAAPLNRSRTTARAITTPAPPSVPWMNRSTIRVQIDGAPAHASDAAT